MGMRVSGLASGLDTEGIIKSLMQAQRIPLDKVKQQKQFLEWKRDDYRSLNTKIASFRDLSFNLKLQSTFSIKQVESSNASIASASVTGNAPEGSYSLKVQQLARGAALSTGTIAGVTDSDSTMGTALSGPLELKLTGNNGAEATITLQPTDKVKDVVSAINAHQAQTGVTVAYNELDRKFVFLNSATGADSRIQLSLSDPNDPDAESGDLLQSVFGFNPGALTGGEAVAQGNNAIVEINGVSATYASNTFAIAGMNVTVKQESASVVNLTVSRDTDAIFNRVKEFVDRYNELLAEINEKLGQRRNRDFPPLTDEQRTEMSEDEIKRWEERAREGTLANDAILTRGLNNFRNTLLGTFSGMSGATTTRLADIGVGSSLLIGNTLTGSFSDQGKLFIDENKLREAIASRPEEVMQLFTATDGNNEQLSADDGFGERIYRAADALFRQVTSTAGNAGSPSTTFAIGREMRTIDDRITTLNRRLSELETRYYRQFTALETFISRSNTQSAYLMQQFSTGG